MIKNFANTLIRWQKKHGRHNLPWQQTDPYKVWVSELMLQQTQVSTVLNYYPKFIQKFPTVQDLAAASLDEVYQQWSGLGYYRRARFLHSGAQMIVKDFNGVFPSHIEDIQKIPGVGRSTAHAIASFCYNQRVSILDGNVQRTLARLTGFTDEIDTGAAQKHFWTLAETLVPKKETQMPAYTQGLMDFGATLCTPKNPQCNHCPFNTQCKALKNNQQTLIPKKKQKKQVPMRIYDVFYYEKSISNKMLHGFIKYKKELGVWEHLHGPTIQLSTIDTSAPNFTLYHTFSHFKAEFRVFINQGTIPDNLIWKEPKAWLMSSIPSPVATMIENVTTPTA